MVDSNTIFMPETVLAPQWHAKLGRLEWLAGGVAIVFLCRMALEEDLAWFGWVMVGALVVLLTVTRWPYGALLVLAE